MVVFLQETDLREGTFVYQVIRPEGVQVRHQPVVGAGDLNYYSVQVHELVAVDGVLEMSADTTFLRLADQSGWIPEMVKGERLLRPLPVEVGLWIFYVDNYPMGQAIRKHPMDSRDSLVTETQVILLPPMQKIYCDRKVVNPVTGVTFYRLQTCAGWVFDKVPAQTETERDVYFLLEPNAVEEGLKIYQALTHMAVRSRTDVTEASMTKLVVHQGQRVAIDIVRQSPYQRGNGPFLRLLDGSGWVFEHKMGLQVMKEIPHETGKWELRVLFPTQLRRHPNDSQDPLMLYSNGVLASQELIVCDLRVAVCEYRDIRGPVPVDALVPNDTDDASTISSTPSRRRLLGGFGGFTSKRRQQQNTKSPVKMQVQQQHQQQQHQVFVHFYRVAGTQGWVFDRRGDQILLELVSGPPPLRSTHSAQLSGTHKEQPKPEGWSPDFVRGIATTIPGLKETAFHAKKCTLSFRTQDEIDLLVYCKTKSVISIIYDSDRGKVVRCERQCSTQDLYRILKRDVIESVLSEDNEDGENKGGFLSEEEAELLATMSLKEQDAKTDNIIKVEPEDEAVEITAVEVPASSSRNQKKLNPNNEIHLFKSSGDSGHYDEEKKEPEAQEDIEEQRLRGELLRFDEDLNAMQAKRKDLLKAIKVFDDERAWVARKHRDETLARWKETQEAVNTNPENDTTVNEEDYDDDEGLSSDTGTLSGTLTGTEGTGTDTEFEDDEDTVGAPDMEVIPVRGPPHFKGNVIKEESSVMSGRPPKNNNKVIKRSSPSPTGVAMTGTTNGALSSAAMVIAPKHSNNSRGSNNGINANSSGGNVSNTTSSSSRSRKTYLCGECYQTFPGRYSRDLHCREVHNLNCAVCDRIFTSRTELDAHKDDSDHW